MKGEAFENEGLLIIIGVLAMSIGFVGTLITRHSAVLIIGLLGLSLFHIVTIARRIKTRSRTK